MATKKKPAKRSVKKTASSAGLPKGFRAIDGMAPTWDYEAEPELIGEWGEPKEVEVKRGKKTETVQCVVVTRDDGKRVTVWKSATLTGLFDEAEEGDRVYIRFDGLGKAKKGQNAPKLFTCAISD